MREAEKTGHVSLRFRHRVDELLAILEECMPAGFERKQAGIGDWLKTLKLPWAKKPLAAPAMLQAAE